MTAIISPEGKHLCAPLTEGEGMLVADLDLSLITKRKRMMDSVGHYARPELLRLMLVDSPQSPVEFRAHDAAPTEPPPSRAFPSFERAVGAGGSAHEQASEI